MKFYSNIYSKEISFTGKRGIAEWMNADCPDIYAEIERINGDKWICKVFEAGISGFWMSEELEPEDRRLLALFIVKSQQAWGKKYGRENILTDISLRAERAATNAGVMTA